MANKEWTRCQIQEIVIEVVGEELSIPLAQINLKDRFITDLGGDSLDFLVIIFHLEEQLEVIIPRRDLSAEEEDGEFTVGAIVDLCCEKMEVE